jgi:putative oxidoreductase
MNQKTEKILLTLLASRPMWGMFPLRIMFGVTLVLMGLARFTLFRSDPGAFIAALPGDFAFAVIVFFAAVEIIGGLLSFMGLGMRFVGTFIMIEMTIAIFIERIPLAFHDLQTQVLLFAIATLLFFSGGGRFSLDRVLAKRLLVKYPDKKKELYLIAETPYTKWWE